MMGPVPVLVRLSTANGIVINHLVDTMAQIIEQVKLMSRYMFQTETGQILGVADPGSAAMDAANLVLPGSKIISVCNGFFSHRSAEMAERVKVNMVRL